MNSVLIAIATVVGIVLVVLLSIALLVSRLFRKVPQGKALVVSTMKDVVVTFTGRVVIPVIHKAEIMDISVKTIEIDRRGQDGLICQDNIRADIAVRFFVRVNKTAEDVIKVAQAIGTERASDQVTLEELFNAKFSEALKTAGKQFDFVDLYTERNRFRDAIVQIIGTDLNGYVLEDAAIDYLEQTPLELLDENNILDAEGIRKITELTAIEHVATNEAQNEETKALTRKNVETREAVLELERQQAEAEARQKREIEVVRAREASATLQVEAEEHQRAEQARITAELAIGIDDENRLREIDVAAKNRERVVAVETEKVEKARQIEVVNREVETTAAERSLEEEKAAIAELQRDRVAVEKDVAREEEAIATLRVVEDASRMKDAVVLEAEGDAQASFVKDIKAAEASEAAANHRAKEEVTIANAELESAGLRSEAQIKLAEGAKAEFAAEGLAEVHVKEADALAIEKLGLAEVHVKEADALATEKQGLAEANVVREKGTAEAEATEAKLKGEASGLTEKADAMRELEGVGQEFEEFSRRLDADVQVRLAEVDANVGIAQAQAEAISSGLSNADIDIVGGSDIFVDRIVSAVSGGKAVDQFVERSETTSTVMGPYLEGERNLVADIGDAVSGLGASGIGDLTLAAFLGRMISASSGERAGQLGQILEAAQGAGLGDVPVGQLLR